MKYLASALRFITLLAISAVAIILLFVKRLHPDAVIPTYAHPSDAGLDLTATTRTDDNNGNIIYGTGLAIEIPSGCVAPHLPSIFHTQNFPLSGKRGICHRLGLSR